MKIVMDEQIELGFPHIIWTHGWMPCVTNTFNVGFASRDFPFPRFPAFFQSLFPGENGRESREIKYGSFYLIRTSNFSVFV
jgi:hypothetical protein